MKRYIKADSDFDRMQARYPQTKYEYEVVGEYYNAEDAELAKQNCRKSPKGISKEGSKYILYTVNPNTAKLADANEKEQYQKIAKLLLSQKGIDTSSWACTEVRNNYYSSTGILLTWNTPFGKVQTNVNLSSYGGKSTASLTLTTYIGVEFDKDFKGITSEGYVDYPPEKFISALESGDFSIE